MVVGIGSLMVELMLVCDRWPLERESVDMSMIGAQLAARWIEENIDQWIERKRHEMRQNNVGFWFRGRKVH